MTTAQALITEHLEAARSETEGHRLFPREDWRYEVDNEDTSLGYDDWLSDKIEFEVEDAVDSIDRFLFRTSKVFTGEISEIEYNQDVVRLFSDLWISDDEAVDRAEGFLQISPERKIFGETFGTAPAELAMELSRIAHLGMVSYEGRCEEQKLQETLEGFCESRLPSADALASVRSRLGRDDENPMP